MFPPFRNWHCPLPVANLRCLVGRRQVIVAAGVTSHYRGRKKRQGRNCLSAKVSEGTSSEAGRQAARLAMVGSKLVIRGSQGGFKLRSDCWQQKFKFGTIGCIGANTKGDHEQEVYTGTLVRIASMCTQHMHLTYQIPTWCLCVY
jgi:hypothetical protein